jgi:hypothetical protein
MYNLNAMNRLFLVVLTVLPFFVGCVPIPVGSENPPGLVDQSTLDSLIGQNKESILDLLGRPDAAFSSEKSSYFIYGAHGGEYQVLLMVWVPIAGHKDEEGTLYCVLLEFDEENIFRQYEINAHSSWSSKSTVSDCALSFFTREELGTLTVVKDEEIEFLLMKSLRKKATQENRDAQWELYQKYPTSENIIWLCRLADQGHKSARNEIGQLYLFGSEQYRKFENVYIEPDLSRSCMWFHLAEEAQITEPREPAELVETLLPYESVEVKRTANTMTENQIAKAKKLILEWEPGQCEHDLSFSLGANYYSDMLSLCKAADYGGFSARDELGRTYFFGLNGVTPNLPRAYMWHHLAASVYRPPIVGYQQSRCDAMTPEQRSIAVKYLNAWRPGLCEQDLTKSKHNNPMP